MHQESTRAQSALPKSDMYASTHPACAIPVPVCQELLASRYPCRTTLNMIIRALSLLPKPVVPKFTFTIVGLSSNIQGQANGKCFARLRLLCGKRGAQIGTPLTVIEEVLPIQVGYLASQILRTSTKSAQHDIRLPLSIVHSETKSYEDAFFLRSSLACDEP